MTKKKFRKMMVALMVKVLEKNGKHIDGKTLAWYRDKDLTSIKAQSYAEAWEVVKPLRDLVGM